MKINLVLQTAPPHLDFTNMPTKEFRAIPDSVCDEIWVDSTLEYLNNDYFPLLIKKLRYGGKLTLIGTELSTVLKAYEVGNIGLDEFTMLVNGGRMNVQPLSLVLDKLKNAGLFVVEVRINSMKYHITAQRPHFIGAI